MTVLNSLDISEAKIQLLNHILDEYSGTGDMEEFQKFEPTLLKLIQQHGFSHAHVALLIRELTEATGMKRGLFKDLLFLKYEDEVEPQEVHSINNFVRDKRMLAMTQVEFEKDRKRYLRKITCYATLDEIFSNAKRQPFQELFDQWFLMDAYLSKLQLKELARAYETQYDEGSFLRFCRGGYLKYGWIVLSVETEFTMKYKLIAVNWDGLNIPEGGTDYRTYRSYR